MSGVRSKGVRSEGYMYTMCVLKQTVKPDADGAIFLQPNSLWHLYVSEPPDDMGRSLGLSPRVDK